MVSIIKIFFICTLFVFLSISLSMRPTSGENDLAPLRIHLSWEGDPRTELTVMWETTRATDSVVEYGSDDSYGSTAQGVSNKPGWATGYIHKVELSELKPDKEYHYRCGSPGYWSGDFTFRTAPELPQDFSFLVIGDSRNPGDYDDDLNSWEMVVQAMKDDIRENEGKYGFIHFLGDNIYNSNQQYVWEKWFNILSMISGETVFMESIGNHEYDYSTSVVVPNYFGQFAFPGNELWFSYDYSNAHIISLDTDSDFSTDSPQYRWLVDDLELISKDEENKWIIVTFHRPPFTSGGKGNEVVQEYLCPLFDQYGVDLVLAGHMHIYERLYPLSQTGEVMDYNESLYYDPPVPIYIIDGCAGAPQYSSYPKDWTAYMEKEYGYSRISISLNGTLHFEHLMVRGGERMVSDEFYLSKSDAVYEIEDHEVPGSGTNFRGIVILITSVVIAIGIVYFMVRSSRRDRDNKENSEGNGSELVSLSAQSHEPASKVDERE